MLDYCEKQKTIKFGIKKLPKISNRLLVLRFDESCSQNTSEILYKYINQRFIIDSGIPFGAIVISDDDIPGMCLRVRIMWSKYILNNSVDVLNQCELMGCNPFIFNGTLNQFYIGRQGS